MRLPLRSRNGLLHTSAVYTVETQLSTVTAPLTAPLTHSLLVALSTFLLSDIFTGEYFLLLFSIFTSFLRPLLIWDARAFCSSSEFQPAPHLKPVFNVLPSWREGERLVLVNFGLTQVWFCTISWCWTLFCFALTFFSFVLCIYQLDVYMLL